MGQLTNQYVSQSYQGLLKMTDSTTGVTGTLQTVQTGDGTDTPLQISKTQVNISGSLTVNGSPVSFNTGSLVTTASFNAYTSSNDSKVNSLIAATGSYATTSSLTSLSSSIATTDLGQNNVIAGLATTSSVNALTGSINSLNAATSSFVTETESGSFLITGSANGNTLTFTKGNGATFNLQVDTGSNSNRNGLITTGSVGGSQSITGSLTMTGSINITGSLRSTDIIGTGSLFLQPNQTDARYLEVYNTSPTDTHITASGGQIFLGDDQTYVKVDNYGSVERIDVVAGNELVVSSSIINLTGSLHQSGTFYPDVIDWIDSSIVQSTGSYILTTNISGVTEYDSYQNIASALQQYINTGSIPSGTVSGSAQIVELGFATTSSVNEKLDTGSFNSYTASIDARTGSYATTGSNVFNGNQTISGSLFVTGSITALSASFTYLETIYQTSSIIFSSGSNILGDEAGDTQTLNGVVNIPLGNLNVTGATTSSLGFFGNLQGTASYATQALSASYAPDNSNRNGLITTGSIGGTQSITGSLNVSGTLNIASGSFLQTDGITNAGPGEDIEIKPRSGADVIINVQNTTDKFIVKSQSGGAIVDITGSLNVTQGITGSLQGTASFATNALSSSHSVNSNTSISSSYSLNSTSASFAQNSISSSHSINSNTSISSSFAQNAVSSSHSVNSDTSISSSYAQTASFASNGGVTQLLAGPNIIISPLSGKGQVTISSTGTGTGSFNTATGSYGSFYDTTNQINPVANTPNSMSFNETAITNGVAISGSISPFNTYIKTENAGIYNLQFSAQVDKTDGGTDSVDIWIRKNGTDLLDTATTVTLNNNNDASVAAWNWFVQSAANDYYQIIWASADTDMRLLAEVSSSVHPGIPSVIATANRIDQFLSNTGSFNGDFNGSFTGSLQGTASFATNALSASYAPDNSNRDGLITTGSAAGTQSITGSLILSGSAGVELDVKGDVLITGSVIMSGSAGVELDIKGDQTNTGSVNILGSLNLRGNQTISGSIIGSSVNNGLIKIQSELNSSSSLSIPFGYISSSNPNEQTNILFNTTTSSTGSGVLANNQTGSIVISGSNNIILNSNRTNTLVTAGTYGYIGGGGNIGTVIPTLGTGSVIRPTINNNALQSGLNLQFTTSSLAAPSITSNLIYGSTTINHNSGSIAYSQNISVNPITSTANNIPLPFNTTINGNYFGGNVTLSHLSSSITTTNNIIAGGNFTVTNLVSSSVSTTNNGLGLLNNLVIGSANGIWVSGSNTSARRNISNNIIGGINTAVSSSQVGADRHLVASIVYGQDLIVSASHTSTTNGGSTFLGRYNDTGSLALSQEIVFAVGTGAGTSNRRTGLWITSGSITNVSGSMNVIGDTIMSSSAAYTLYASGTIGTQRIHFDGNPFNADAASNLGAIRFDSTNTKLEYTNYDRAEITTRSFIEQIVVTGSLYTETKLSSRYAGTSGSISVKNTNGVRLITIDSDSTTITGSLNVTAGITGSLQGTASYATQALTASFALNGGGGGSTFPFTGSAVITGSLEVIGNTNFTGSVDITSSLANALNVSGTMNVQRIQLDTSPFVVGTLSNLGAIRFNTNTELNISNYDKTLFPSGAYIDLTTNTGSNFSQINLYAKYGGVDNDGLKVSNYNGSTATEITTDNTYIVGNTTITGSVQGNVNALSISSNTASLNLNDGNFFTLQLVSGSATHINPSNIKPGQTVNILLNTTGSGTVNFPSSVKQVSGSTYVPTTTTSKDIITLVSFDSSSLFLANVKNLI